MNNVDITYARSDDGLVHVCIALQGLPRNICGAAPESLVERMLVADATCLACIARMREAQDESELERQLRDSLANRTIGEYAKDDAETTLKLWQALKAKR